jgi:8-oxo-dGTP diphosphatase
MTEPQPVGACAIFINAESQILLGKRKNSYKAGMYGMPGGRIDPNEPLISAISREVKEEAGIDNLKFSFVGVVRENQGVNDFIHFIFLAHVDAQEPVLCEPDKCEGWEWVNASFDLSEVLPGHKAAIELYRNKEIMADLVQ